MVKIIQDILKSQKHRLGNFVSSVAFKILTSLVYLVCIPWFIRTRGEASYGVIAIFLTVHGFVSMIDAGFSYALGYRYTRAIAQKDPNHADIFNSGFTFYLLIASLIALTGFAFSDYLSNFIFSDSEHKLHVSLFILSISVLVLSAYFVVGLLAHEKLFNINLNRFALDLIKGLGLILILILNASNPVFVYYVLAGSLAKLLMDYLAFSKIQKFEPIFNRNELRENFKIGWISIMTSILSFVLVMGDKVMVIGKISKDIFGSYSFAVDLNARAYFLIYAVFSTVYPIMIKANSVGKNMKTILQVSAAGVFVVICAYYLPLFVFSRSIVEFFVDKKLNPVVVDLIRIFAVAAIGYMVFGLTEIYLNSIGRAKNVLMCYCAAVVVFFSVITPMMEWKGVVGAALTFMIVHMTLAACGILFSIFAYYKNMGKMTTPSKIPVMPEEF